MTTYEYAKKIMTLYENAYELTEHQHPDSRLSFSVLMEDNGLDYCVINFEYNGNYQKGRYVIPFNKDFFVINVESEHNINNIKWSIENE